MALKTLFESFKKEQSMYGFGNQVAIANENAVVRDMLMEELEVEPDIDGTEADALEKFKDEAVDDADIEKFIDDIPEADLDAEDAAAVAAEACNVPEDADAYVGASFEAMLRRAEGTFPETEEI